MKLSDISTVVRPRSKWQAVDLGFRMASQWFNPLILGWLMVTMPFFVILQLLLWDKAWIALLIFWWLKPLWERVQLVYLSVRQFGEALTLKQQFHSYRTVVFRQLLATLLWRRLSPQRSYTVPVVQLENLSGNRRQQRMHLFDGTNQQAAFWLTLVGMFLEVFIMVATYALLYLLIPPDANVEFDLFDILNTITVLDNVIIYGAMALVAPFFVAGGFSLYLNQRTQIEGWDIEITFRRMVERQQQKQRTPKLTMAFVLISLLGIAGNDTVQAAEVPTSAEQRQASKLARDIVAGESFNQIKIKSYPEFYLNLEINQDKDENREPSNLPKWLSALLSLLAGSIELILTAIVVALAILLIYRYRHWLAQFMPNAKPLEIVDQPTSVFGLDITKETMPDNPAAKAQELWSQGQKRQALSLLYRGSLFNLVGKEHLTVHDSFTEGECVQQVKKNAQPQTAAYFEQLTQNWQRLAYAGIMPPEASMQQLFDQWPEIFSESEDGR